jgi:hypothetical protein
MSMNANATITDEKTNDIKKLTDGENITWKGNVRLSTPNLSTPNIVSRSRPLITKKECKEFFTSYHNVNSFFDTLSSISKFRQ